MIAVHTRQGDRNCNRITKEISYQERHYDFDGVKSPRTKQDILRIERQNPGIKILALTNQKGTEEINILKPCVDPNVKLILVQGKNGIWTRLCCHVTIKTSSLVILDSEKETSLYKLLELILLP